MYNKLMNKNKERREQRKKWAIAYLGGTCAKCGVSSELEFDHIDPASKDFVIGANLKSSEDTLSKELDKCQLLCVGCHREKSAKETVERASERRAGREHGTANWYNNRQCRCDKCKESWAQYIKLKRHEGAMA